jgi:hypothetical protein
MSYAHDLTFLPLIMCPPPSRRCFFLTSDLFTRPRVPTGHGPWYGYDALPSFSARPPVPGFPHRDAKHARSDKICPPVTPSTARARKGICITRLSTVMGLYIHPLYVLVSKILFSILNFSAPIHPLYHPLSTVRLTCHFI